MPPRFRFEHEPGTQKPDVLEMFAKMTAALGQATAEEAEYKVSIGGDGMMLDTLSKANGTPVLPLTPQDSNSTGFWTYHDIDTPEDLEQRVATAQKITLKPLKAEIEFENGTKRILYAFNDVAFVTDSGQSLIINIRPELDKDDARAPQAELPLTRLMGDGMLFSTALGSTGTNRSNGGPIIDLCENVIIATGKLIGSPMHGISPFVCDGNRTSFYMTFTSAACKRPVRVDYDGKALSGDDTGSPVVAARVSVANDRAETLLVGQDPILRVFRAL